VTAEGPADETAVPDPERFFAGAVRRILKFLTIISGILVLPVAWLFGRTAAAGFLAGALVSWLNFRALARGVEGIAERIVERHSRERGSVLALRFLLRYVLVAGIAYAIFKGSTQAFRGFLFGVCVPVAAMLAEATYEGYMAFRRGY
jgi:hypothetical protein